MRFVLLVILIGIFLVEIVESQSIIIYTAPRRFNSSDFVSPVIII
jgi:hypothetical protein